MVSEEECGEFILQVEKKKRNLTEKIRELRYWTREAIHARTVFSSLPFQVKFNNLLNTAIIQKTLYRNERAYQQRLDELFTDLKETNKTLDEISRTLEESKEPKVRLPSHLPERTMLQAPKQLLALASPPPKKERIIPMGSESGVNKLQPGGRVITIGSLEPRGHEKKRYEPEEEAETRERLAKLPGGGLLSPSTPIEEARKRPERPPTAIPTTEGASPERRRDERSREERGPGAIRGYVLTKPKEGEKGVSGVKIKIEGGDRKFEPTTRRDGQYYQPVPSTIEGVEYIITVIEVPKEYKPSSDSLTAMVYSGQITEADDIYLEPKEEGWRGKVRKGLPILRRDWWTGKVIDPETGKPTGVNQFVRLGITLFFTLVLYFAFWNPLFDAIGQKNLIFSFVIPGLVTPLVLFFFIAPKITKPDWGPLILALLTSGGILAVMFFLAPAFLKNLFFSTSYFWVGAWLATFLFMYNFAGRKDRGMGKTLLTYGGILLILGSIFLIWNLVGSGKALQIETYLKTFDVLKLIGIPQETIDNMKDGVRNTLSFLQFKGAEPTKPEAKKIGGFEAIQLKFGSKFNDFIVPTLFARMDYTLPVTVINPNTLASQIPPVESFYIDEIFLMNASDQRILCGEISTCNKYEYSVDNTGDIVIDKTETNNRCIINPEEDKSITIAFNNKTDCRKTVKTYRDSYIKNPTNLNPMFPAKFRQDAKEVQSVCAGDEDKLPDLGGGGSKREQCRIAQCAEECSLTVSNFNQNYGLPKPTTYNFDKEKGTLTSITGDNPSGDELDFDLVKLTGTRYIENDNVCECKVKRYYNIMDNLCFMSNNKAKIELRSHFNFSVDGKGELIIVKSESDRKLAPKPSITSGAGPLTITTYFIPDVNVIEEKKSNVKMFIQIENDGDGTAEIGNNDINFTSDKEILKIDKNTCAPQSGIFVDKEITTIVCDATVTIDSISGSYLTVPVIVDINYTYSQEHSVTLNVRKVSIPDGVIDSEEEAELNRQFGPLPYYCPTRDVDDTKPLVIYSPPS